MSLGPSSCNEVDDIVEQVITIQRVEIAGGLLLLELEFLLS